MSNFYEIFFKNHNKHFPKFFPQILFFQKIEFNHLLFHNQLFSLILDKFVIQY